MRCSSSCPHVRVYEDDGCGVVGYVCAVALSKVACAVNCATDLIVTGECGRPTECVRARYCIVVSALHLTLRASSRLFPTRAPAGVNYNNSRPVLPGKVVISASQASELYVACRGYAWCGTQQESDRGEDTRHGWR